MAVPKQRHTKSRRDRRRAHIRLFPAKLITCSKCGKLKLPHAVCSYCGYYNGREVIDVLKEVEEGEEEKIKRDATSRKKPRGFKFRKTLIIDQDVSSPITFARYSNIIYMGFLRP